MNKKGSDPVAALVLHSPVIDRYLLQLHTKSMKYGFPTGRVDPVDEIKDKDEFKLFKHSSAKTIIREAKEELNLDLYPSSIYHLGTVFPPSVYPGHENVRFEANVYFAEFNEALALQLINKEPEVCSELLWLSLQEILALPSEKLRVTTIEILKEDLMMLLLRLVTRHT